MSRIPARCGCQRALAVELEGGVLHLRRRGLELRDCAARALVDELEGGVHLRRRGFELRDRAARALVDELEVGVVRADLSTRDDRSERAP